ncbi:sterol desaturase family protein [Kitasatospora sp. NPDC048407]|uniref:sterol desaturase family protein n=1 Tax=Kitasatospora sp. NPDC048407 TaxID=3364051 RepID=UPI00371960AA
MNQERSFGQTAEFRTVLRYAAYPALLFTVPACAVATLHQHWDIGRVLAAFQVGTIGYLWALERLIPYRRDWHPGGRELRCYAVYFVLTMVGGALGQLLVAALVARLAPPHPTLPLRVEIPLALLTGSLAKYLFHRWSHHQPWLWRLHGVHHALDKVNVTNNGVNHLLDVLLGQALVQLALAWLGFSRESVFCTSLFVVAQGYFVHANIDVRIGRLNHVFGSPEQHRLHHSTVLAESGHFGADLAIWDHLFGSFTWRPGRRPVAVGLHDPASFPPTTSVLASLLHPWRPAPDATTGPSN